MRYVDLLMATMTSSPSAPDQDHVTALLLALADLERSRRSVGNEDVSQVLAHELAYDRALICLSRHIGIDAAPERFEVPRVERDRLHRELVEVMPSLEEVLFPSDGAEGQG